MSGKPQSVFGNAPRRTPQPQTPRTPQRETPSTIPTTPVQPLAAAQEAKTASQRELEQAYAVIAANNGWGRVVSPEDIKPWMNRLQQYVVNTPFHIDAPSFKGKQDCPSTHGKKWNAHLKPEPALDVKLGQQWSIRRKDYRGRNTQLFCYPNGTFDGEKFEVDEVNNPAVDLDLYAYASPDDVTGSLQTLMELIFPNNNISKVDRDRVKITDSIIAFQRNSKVQSAKQDAIDELTEILGRTSNYVTLSRQAKENTLKSKAKNLVEMFHNIAIANIGLELAENDEAKQKQCARSGGTKKNIDGVDACVPTQAIINQVEQDPDLLTREERKKVTDFLINYAKEIVALKEKVTPKSIESTFASLTSHQQKKGSRAN